jgi:hypothetical protein
MNLNHLIPYICQNCGDYVNIRVKSIISYDPITAETVILEIDNKQTKNNYKDSKMEILIQYKNSSYYTAEEIKILNSKEYNRKERRKILNSTIHYK